MGQRASMTTTLSFGLVEAPVALYKAVEEQQEKSWDLAGPHGGSLVREQVIVGTEEIYDPLAEQLKASVPDADLPAPPPTDDAPPPTAGAFVETEPALFEVLGPAVIGGEPVKVRIQPDEVCRGVRLDDGRWLDLEAALQQIDGETKLDRIEVVGFIRRERVPRHRIVGAYYLGARGSAKPLVLLYERMRAKGRVAVVKWSKVKNQAEGILLPWTDDGGKHGLVVLQLSWAADQRPLPDDAILPAVGISQAEEEAADALVAALSDSPDLVDDLIDDRRRLTAELLDKARNGEVFELPERETVPEDVPMAERLERSVAALAAPVGG